jgi:hypothetical protein
MSTLLLHLLESSIYQEETSDYAMHKIGAIRPHLMRFGNPAGNLTMQIQDRAGEPLFTSETINISSIGSGTYWHGYYPFLITGMLRKFTPYRFVLIAGGGYSFSESAYIGWCNGFDLGKYIPEYAGGIGWSAPLDLEIWSYEQVIKGVQ